MHRQGPRAMRNHTIVFMSIPTITYNHAIDKDRQCLPRLHMKRNLGLTALLISKWTSKSTCRGWNIHRKG